MHGHLNVKLFLYIGQFHATCFDVTYNHHQTNETQRNYYVTLYNNIPSQITASC